MSSLMNDHFNHAEVEQFIPDNITLEQVRETRVTLYEVMRTSRNPEVLATLTKLLTQAKDDSLILWYDTMKPPEGKASVYAEADARYQTRIDHGLASVDLADDLLQDYAPFDIHQTPNYGKLLGFLMGSVLVEIPKENWMRKVYSPSEYKVFGRYVTLPYRRYPRGKAKQMVTLTAHIIVPK